ncbi:acyl-CoA dehydrogenase family protein [Fangia hongkongensis]|uniref:acyl-CoA dehydrogenase family protein n=1 Tax=Fangia hongkongensis TaxID=270495 RepID=UPI00036452A7|nr:acyl-CoA dehydrogenase family protein [Fangia hongkongensis]MBK2123868.1 acyl-CoA dehydrogenase family protein [Fangia hongkongensis]
MKDRQSFVQEEGFDAHDPLLFDAQLTDEETEVRKVVREFAQAHLYPTVTKAYRDQALFLEKYKEMGKLGILGGDCCELYGGRRINSVSYGLIAYELERVDSGYRTLYSVASSLVMHAIYAYGSEQQKEMWLSKLLKAEAVGGFALTEPEHGSDTGAMESSVKKHEAGYILNGKKRWIGLGNYADILIVWAKDEEGVVRGFIVPRSQRGVSTKDINGKLSLRTVPQADITFDNVYLERSYMLPKAKGFSAPFSCLNQARYGISWGVLGAAQSCLDKALKYSQSRHIFGQSLAAKQITQQKLVNMQVEIALGLQACYRVAQLMEMGRSHHNMISLLKLNSTQKALKIAQDARDLLGGNGILDDYDVMRHLTNLYAVDTYEGTSTIHTLILGKALTGVPAF